MSQLAKDLLMHIRGAGLPAPEREVPVCPELGHRFDLCYQSERVAIEVDGGTFSGGRHSRGVGYAEDCFKLNLATLLGYRVLRFTGAMIESGQALAMIEAALGRRPAAEIVTRRASETAERRSAGAKAGWMIRKAKERDRKR